MDPNKAMAGWVEVRLIANQMRHEILQMIPDYTGALATTIREQVEQVCARAPEIFAKEIQRQIDSAIHDEIRRIVQDAVRKSEMIQQAIHDEASRQVSAAFADWHRFSQRATP